MPTVYLVGEGHKQVFHREADCRHIVKPPPRGQRGELREVDLDDIRTQRPCRTCYPDAPRARFQKRFCPTCNKNQSRPCAHNGGIRVYYEVTYKTRTLYHEPGDVSLREKYVWPDRVRHYMSA